MNSVITFQQPDGGLDGIYIHFSDASGIASSIYEGFPASSTYFASESSTGGLHSRQTATTDCENGVSTTAADFAGAAQMLASWFGGSRSFYGHNTAVAYGCNYGEGQTYTSSQFMNDILSINNTCQATGAGWVSSPGSGYGRTLATKSFCGTLNP